MTLRIAIDVGGTFTDGVLYDEDSSRIWLAKSLTTYADPGNAIATVAEALIAQHGTAGEVSQVVHGTTLITNSLIERKGVRTALITNEGMSDLIDIRREMRYDTYDLALTYPRALVAREDRYEISARLGPDGAEWAPLDEAEVAAAARSMRDSGVGALAICLLHAPVEPAQERRVREIIQRECPGLPVSISAEVAGEIGEYERMSTTTANAFVQPLVKDYLERLQTRFQEAGIPARLDIMVSNGAFTTAAQAADYPIRLLESGPAGGVLSAINCAASHAADHVLAFDMGGTTAKSCVAVDGVPEITHSFEFSREKRFKKGSGLPALTPSIDLIEIGAGGGSIARISALGLLQVGPESAGSEPGPACYGRGGEDPTVTDADVLLGYLDPDAFLGGRMRLDTSAATSALARVGAAIGLDAVQAAVGIHDIVNENMAAAARTHIAEKGLDARRFTLVATGGAGPVHAADVARRLRIRRILCPVASGVGSCLGFLAAPARADRSWSRIEPLPRFGLGPAEDRIAAARAEIRDELVASGSSAGDIAWEGLVAMRYSGQGAAVDVPFDPTLPLDREALCSGFETAYRKVFGRLVPGGTPELVTFRVWGTVGENVRRYRIGDAAARTSAPGARMLYLAAERGFHEVPVHERLALEPGRKLRGPCVITEAESTLVIAHRADVSVLSDGTIEVILDEVAG